MPGKRARDLKFHSYPSLDPRFPKSPWGTTQGTEPPFLICQLCHKTIDYRDKAVGLLLEGEGKSGA